MSMLHKNYYTLKDIKKSIGCSQRQLQYWEKKGYIDPKLGPRNVRLYNKKDINKITQLYTAKKAGKTLGEAWGECIIEMPIKKKNLEEMNQLSQDWLNANANILEYLKKIPIQEDLIKTLQNHHKEALELIKKRDAIATNIANLTDTKKQQITLTFEEKQIDSIDGLILYWAKHKDQYNKDIIAPVREQLFNRLKRGETFESLILEIKSSSLKPTINDR